MRGGKAAPVAQHGASEMNINIPLKDLAISPLNVRKTPPTAADQAELAASIFAHALLENLYSILYKMIKL